MKQIYLKNKTRTTSFSFLKQKHHMKPKPRDLIQLSRYTDEYASFD